MNRYCWTALLVLALPAALAADSPFFLRDGQRVVFLGDSNTFAGHYIAMIDAYLFTRFPDKKFELINLGLPSETVSGLSEPDHPYPRPDVHERLERVLAKTKPDVVVACYGMNDGIYYPFSAERLKKYQLGIEKLIDKVSKTGAKVVLMTPLPFDPRPIKKKLLASGAEKYSWMTPYENYDEVLGKYSEWLLSLRKKAPHPGPLPQGERGMIVADAHGAINNYLAFVRKSESGYFVCGDGIHPNPTGHLPAARELLEAWQAPAEVDLAEIDGLKGKRGKLGPVGLGKNGTYQFTWTTHLPQPLSSQLDPRVIEHEKISDRLNRHRLVFTGTAQERFSIFEGDMGVGEVTKEELAKGVDLTRFPDLSTNRQAAEVWKLAEERQKLLGLAWLTDVGHKRPDTPKGLPLEEAKAKAEKLEKKIRELAQPAKITLRLVPVKKQ